LETIILIVLIVAAVVGINVWRRVRVQTKWRRTRNPWSDDE
jgi:hypothetical protein